jgi:6,7-dimethyl-8-ribityllumazine synthase
MAKGNKTKEIPKMITYYGKLGGSGLKVGIVVSRFNEFISSKLLNGALDCLIRHDVADKDISIVWVPGAWEIAMTAKKMVESEKYQAVICLGAVIRGETPHFDYVAAESAKGIAQLGLEGKAPVIYGVITADSTDQAIERAGTKSGNKGWTAALSAIEMANVYKVL